MARNAKKTNGKHNPNIVVPRKGRGNQADRIRNLFWRPEGASARELREEAGAEWVRCSRFVVQLYCPKGVDCEPVERADGEVAYRYCTD
jgi:hypothetical protein